MKKTRLILISLAASAMMVSAICLSSCNKNKANEDLSLPTIETAVYVESNPELGFECPYCQKIILPGESHTHHFSPMMGESALPSYPHDLTWGVLDSIDDNGNVVYELDENGNPTTTPIHQRMGNKAKPFPVDYCETNLPQGVHFCRYCAEKRYHRHSIIHSLEPVDGYSPKSWHLGGGIEP